MISNYHYYYRLFYLCSFLISHLISAELLGQTQTNHPKFSKFPVIYCSDLFHPHEDPDDHFDLAVLHSIPQIDIKGVVLDQGDRQLKQPGGIPISQVSYLTGKKINHASGLGAKLTSPNDDGRSRPAAEQLGIEMILGILRSSKEPVTIITVGSVRDVAAAYNREPVLFKQNVKRVLCFIGEASNQEFSEYNVELDPNAYICLFRSGLPIYWFPCFDGGAWQNRGHASFWQAKHDSLLHGASSPWIQYFIFALEKMKTDPIQFIQSPVDVSSKKKLFDGTRNLWCTALFLIAADHAIFSNDKQYSFLPFDWSTSNIPSSDNPALEPLFGFEDVTITLNNQAVVHYSSNSESKNIKRFKVLKPKEYAEGMTQITARLISSLRSIKPIK